MVVDRAAGRPDRLAGGLTDCRGSASALNDVAVPSAGARILTVRTNSAPPTMPMGTLARIVAVDHPCAVRSREPHQSAAQIGGFVLSGGRLLSPVSPFDHETVSWVARMVGRCRKVCLSATTGAARGSSVPSVDGDRRLGSRGRLKEERQ